MPWFCQTPELISPELRTLPSSSLCVPSHLSFFLFLPQWDRVVGQRMEVLIQGLQINVWEKAMNTRGQLEWTGVTGPMRGPPVSEGDLWATILKYVALGGDVCLLPLCCYDKIPWPWKLRKERAYIGFWFQREKNPWWRRLGDKQQEWQEEQEAESSCLNGKHEVALVNWNCWERGTSGKAIPAKLPQIEPQIGN